MKHTTVLLAIGLAGACLLTTFNLFGQTLAINEVVAANPGFYPDEDGDFVDYIELHNYGSASIDLNGYGLSDNPDQAFQWVFPNYTMSPGEFLVVFCSDKNRLTLPFHSNFRIAQGGEGVWVHSPDGNQVDVFPVISVAEGYSAVRLPDGTGVWERTVFSSPGETNTAVPHLAFSLPSGRYEEGTSVELTTANGLTIHLTTDGSEPNSESAVYVQALSLQTLPELSEGTAFISTSPTFLPPEAAVPAIHVIRARAFDGDVPVSEVFTRTFYTGNEGISGIDDYPIVSVVMEPSDLFDAETGIYVPGTNFDPNNSQWTGNYFQRGVEWERTASVSVLREGKLAWEQLTGVRIHGGKTRNAPQKSLRVYSRGALGATKFNDRLFETKEKRVFDKFILQAQYGCWNKTMVKDAVSSRVAQGLDFDVQHARPALVFINGVYWGIHLFRDYYDSDYFEEEYGTEAETVSILLHGSGTNPSQGSSWGIVEGSNDHYLELMNLLATADVNQVEVFEEISERMDVSSMIDFYATAIYLNQYDWPSNNHKVWRSSSDGKWRWMMYDFDSAWGYRPVSFDMMNYAAHPSGTSIYNTPYTTFLFRKLLESEVFVQRFLARYACLLRGPFAAENIEAHLDAYVGAYAPLVLDHIDRWRNLSGLSEWEMLVNLRLYDFNQQRKEHAIAHISDWFGFDFDPDAFECDDPIEPPVGISDTDVQTVSVVCYPNPAENVLHVLTPEPSMFFRYCLLTASGSQLASGEFTQGKALDVSRLPSGMYVLVLEGEHSVKAARFAIR
ncbi:MAG: CotH kinase family protein [Flavobacteriales bacterium]